MTRRILILVERERPILLYVILLSEMIRWRSQRWTMNSRWRESVCRRVSSSKRSERL